MKSLSRDAKLRAGYIRMWPKDINLRVINLKMMLTGKYENNVGDNGLKGKESCMFLSVIRQIKKLRIIHLKGP